MDHSEGKCEAGSMAQLAFSFEAASYEKNAGSVVSYEADPPPYRGLANTAKAEAVVLAFPQDRVSVAQARLVQRIVQRNRFF